MRPSQGWDRDPRPVGDEIAALLRSRGWQQRLLAARITARWPQVVGEAVAAHCQPGKLEDDGTLQVVADSAAWATQLSYLQMTLLERLAVVCGAGVVKRLHVHTDEARTRRWRSRSPEG
jgi:predicted nucleic acid-binding Zn ribbon protein